MGEYGSKAYVFSIIEAAQILRHSAVDLMRDPERSELMAIAFAYKHGKSQGEFDREFNRKYQDQVKAAATRVQEARK